MVHRALRGPSRAKENTEFHSLLNPIANWHKVSEGKIRKAKTPAVAAKTYVKKVNLLCVTKRFNCFSPVIQLRSAQENMERTAQAEEGKEKNLALG